MTTILSKNAELAKQALLIQRGIAPGEMLASMNFEDVYAIKSDSGAKHFRAAGGDPVVQIKADGESDDPRARTFIYTASRQSMDRMGDVVVSDGIDWTYFRENNIALWSHDGDRPVGNVTFMEKVLNAEVPFIRQGITFPKFGASPHADVTHKLVAAGVLKACSIAFIPMKTTRAQNADERAKMGVGDYGVRFDKVDQIELSPCSIPMHPGALIEQRSLRSEKNRVAQQCSELIARGILDAKEVDAFLEGVRASPRLIFPVQRVLVLARSEPVAHVEPVAAQIAEFVDPHAATIKSLTDSNAELKARVEKLEGAHATLAADVAALPKPGAQPRSLATDPANYDVILNSPIKVKQTLLTALSKSA